MECPKCGYIMDHFDSTCRRCGTDPSSVASAHPLAPAQAPADVRFDVLPGRLGEVLAHVWPYGLHGLEWCIHASPGAAIAAHGSAVLILGASALELNCTAFEFHQINSIRLDKGLMGTQSLWLDGPSNQLMGSKGLTGIHFDQPNAHSAGACAEWIAYRATSALRQMVEVFAAAVAGGHPPAIDAPVTLNLKPGEVPVFATRASLIKERAVRAYSGGSRGVSIRVAKGVSFRVGAHSGSTRTVGTETVADDQGDLVLTTQRIIFIGSKRTSIVPLAKLVAADCDDNGFVILAKDGRSTTDRLAVLDRKGFLLRLAVLGGAEVGGLLG